MMFFIPLAVLSLAAAALGAPFEKRQTILNGGVYYCTEPGFLGVCARTPPISEGCHNFDATFNNRLNSFRPEPQNYVSSNLIVKAYIQEVGYLAMEVLADLSTYNFNNTASSYQCKSS
ncbi:unnamed protein product [Rhizoctonia solani]|uniref:Uncharacterized protein n=1 Tax=Rhizoctonia solani TaxID=456999 RepID=A0A8H3ASP9_9AGAM|nr:unnamed protein product [Rhizoctonia solani]